MRKCDQLRRAALLVFLILLFGVKAQGAAAPDKLIGIHSARVMS